MKEKYMKYICTLLISIVITQCSAMSTSDILERCENSLKQRVSLLYEQRNTLNNSLASPYFQQKIDNQIYSLYCKFNNLRKTLDALEKELHYVKQLGNRFNCLEQEKQIINQQEMAIINYFNNFI